MEESFDSTKARLPASAVVADETADPTITTLLTSPPTPTTRTETTTTTATTAASKKQNHQNPPLSEIRSPFLDDGPGSPTVFLPPQPRHLLSRDDSDVGGEQYFLRDTHWCMSSPPSEDDESNIHIVHNRFVDENDDNNRDHTTTAIRVDHENDIASVDYDHFDPATDEPLTNHALGSSTDLDLPPLMLPPTTTTATTTFSSTPLASPQPITRTPPRVMSSTSLYGEDLLLTSSIQQRPRSIVCVPTTADPSSRTTTQVAKNTSSSNSNRNLLHSNTEESSPSNDNNNNVFGPMALPVLNISSHLNRSDDTEESSEKDLESASTTSSFHHDDHESHHNGAGAVLPTTTLSHQTPMATWSPGRSECTTPPGSIQCESSVGTSPPPLINDELRAQSLHERRSNYVEHTMISPHRSLETQSHHQHQRHQRRWGDRSPGRSMPRGDRGLGSRSCGDLHPCSRSSHHQQNSTPVFGHPHHMATGTTTAAAAATVATTANNNNTSSPTLHPLPHPGSQTLRPPRAPNVQLRLQPSHMSSSISSIVYSNHTAQQQQQQQQPASSKQPMQGSIGVQASFTAAHGFVPHRRGHSTGDDSLLSALTDGEYDGQASSAAARQSSHRMLSADALSDWDPEDEAGPKSSSGSVGGMDIDISNALLQPILGDDEDDNDGDDMGRSNGDDDRFLYHDLTPERSAPSSLSVPLPGDDPNRTRTNVHPSICIPDAHDRTNDATRTILPHLSYAQVVQLSERFGRSWTPSATTTVPPLTVSALGRLAQHWRSRQPPPASPFPQDSSAKPSSNQVKATRDKDRDSTPATVELREDDSVGVASCHTSTSIHRKRSMDSISSLLSLGVPGGVTQWNDIQSYWKECRVFWKLHQKSFWHSYWTSVQRHFFPSTIIATVLFLLLQTFVPGHTGVMGWLLLCAGVRHPFVWSLTCQWEQLVRNFPDEEAQHLLKLVGPSMSFVIHHSQGWPRHMVVYGLSGLLFHFAEMLLTWSWILGKNWSVFAQNAKTDSNTSNETYLRVLLSVILLGVFSSAKRSWMSTRLATKVMTRYRGAVRCILEKLILMSELAAISNRDPSIESGSHFLHDRDSGRIKRNLSKEYFQGRVHHPAKLTEASTVADWIGDNQKEWGSSNTSRSLKDVVEFRQILQELDGCEFPFSTMFGRVTNREALAKASANVYKKLARSPQSSISVLAFSDVCVDSAIVYGKMTNAKRVALGELLRPDKNDEISSLHFAKRVDSVYRELRTLSSAIRNTISIEKEFEYATNLLLYATAFVWTMYLIWGYTWLNPILTICGFTLSAFLAFGFIRGENLGGFLLILSNRPYDVGDHIRISNQSTKVDSDEADAWIVHDISLFRTTLRSALTSEIATMPNGKLSQCRISNARLSGNANIVIRLKFNIDAQTSSLSEFQTNVKQFVQDRPQDFTMIVKFNVTHVDAIAGCTEYSLVLQSRDTWQEFGSVMDSKAKVSVFVFKLQARLHLNFSDSAVSSLPKYSINSEFEKAKSKKIGLPETPTRKTSSAFSSPGKFQLRTRSNSYSGY